MESIPPDQQRHPEREEQWLKRLKNLYLEHADEEFLLAAAMDFDRLADTPFDELYDEVADRALYCALRSGTFERIATALNALRPTATERPLARLAQALLLLEAGHRREAHGFLEDLESAPVDGAGVASWFAETVDSLRVLSSSDAGISAARDAAKIPPEVSTALRRVPLPLRRNLRDYLRLERALWLYHRTPGLAELPQTVGLSSSRGRLLWSFFRTLKGFRTGSYRPGPGTVRKLEQVLTEARRSQDGAGHGHLFGAAEERLRLFQTLLDLERSLGRGEPPVEVTWRRLREFLATHHPLLIRLLPQKPPALLGTLEHAWRHRWYELLERIGNTFDCTLWSEFFAFHPQVFNHHLTPLNPDLGSRRAMRYLRLDRLLRGEQFSELALLLATRSFEGSLPPDQLVRLWACELWARRQACRQVYPHLQPPIPSSTSETAHPDDSGATLVRQTLVRLREMATSLKQRFAARSRPEVARVLRDEVFAITSQHGFAQGFIPLTEDLLESLPADLGLLTVGLAAAQIHGDGKARHRFATRCTRRTSFAVDPESFLPLLRRVAAEPPEHAEAILRQVKACLGEAGWNRIEGLLAEDPRQNLRPSAGTPLRPLPDPKA